MNKKKLILPIYVFVEAIYFFVYLSTAKNSDEPLESQLFIPVWIVCGLINSYFVVFNIIPDDFKVKLKSKNIVLKLLFYLLILSIGFFITNGPAEIFFSK
tara:strand:- start:114 stop:413 length:300 start_codon:yes stop_codon:yes gene_type:complete